MEQDRSIAENVGNDAESTPRPVLPVNELAYRSTAVDPQKLVVIKRLPAFEAMLAKSMLEAEGIMATVDDWNIAGIHPLLVHDVPLRVLQMNAEQALAILGTRAARDNDADEPDLHCRKCNGIEIESLPLTPAVGKLRNAIVIGLALPMIVLIIAGLAGDDSIYRAAPEFGWATYFVVLILTIFAALFVVKPRQRCVSCGAKW